MTNKSFTASKLGSKLNLQISYKFENLSEVLDTYDFIVYRFKLPSIYVYTNAIEDSIYLLIHEK